MDNTKHYYGDGSVPVTTAADAGVAAGSSVALTVEEVVVVAGVTTGVGFTSMTTGESRTSENFSNANDADKTKEITIIVSRHLAIRLVRNLPTALFRS